MPYKSPQAEKLDLDDFMLRANDTLHEFAEATREAARTDPDMDPKRPRPEAWWWRDVAAYLNMKEVAERVNAVIRPQKAKRKPKRRTH